MSRQWLPSLASVHGAAAPAKRGARLAAAWRDGDGGSASSSVSVHGAAAAPAKRGACLAAAPPAKRGNGACLAGASRDDDGGPA